MKDSICPPISNENILNDIGYFKEDHLGFDILENFTKSKSSLENSFETLLGSGFISTRSDAENMRVRNNDMETREIFPKGLPDQFTIVFVYEAKEKMKSWVRLEIYHKKVL